MIQTYLCGSAMTHFGRYPDVSVKEQARSAIFDALADAGIEAPDVGAFVFSNAAQGTLEGQHMVRGQVALRAMGIGGVPVINVDNACAGGATAMYQAVALIRSGMADVAVAIGSEKMSHPDRARSFGIFDGAWDVSLAPEILDQLGITNADSAKARSPFMDVYAMQARSHMERFGITQLHLAHVASKNHAHSALNPKAHYQQRFSVEEVLAAREIIWPLTLPMCSPMSDGACAVVLASEAAAKRLGLSRQVRVAASVLTSGSDHGAEDLGRAVGRLAAERAYQEAGVGPNDMSVAEVHDASAFGEVLQSENLGFAAVGDGGAIAVRGETSLGGRIPINPSGGLECRGHPIGATGLAQLHELVLQLRRRADGRQVAGARWGIAENGGGFGGVEELANCVTILQRMD